MYKRVILFVFIVVIFAITHAQNKLFSINGIVLDSVSNDTLIGATVLIKNTTKGTITDENGRYKLNFPSGEYILVFTYIGYKQQEVNVNLDRDQFLIIRLSPVLKYIEEIKITGQKKFFGNIEYGRDIPSISAKEIKKLNTTNASDILHASISGVWATKTSGSPGDHQKIRIRGQNSFFSSSEPLYIVDGVPVPIVNMASLGIGDLNIYDIENVTVLRDASSTALFGFQGGNGVVLIDTKKGGDKEISFSTKVGTLWFDNFYDLMGTEDFLETLELADRNIKSYIRKYYPSMSDTIKSDDWQDEIFNNALSKEFQLSISGNAGKKRGLKYYISGNLTDQEGILPEVEYKRYNVAFRLSKAWKKIAIDLAYRGSLQNNKNNQDLYSGNLMLYKSITNSPCYRSTPDSFYYTETQQGKNLNMRSLCPYPEFNRPYPMESFLKNNHHNLFIKTHNFSTSGRYQFSHHLSLNAMASIMLRKSKYDFTQDFFHYKSDEEIILINHQYNISYFNSFNNNNIGLVAAYRYYTDNLWWIVDSINGIPGRKSYLRNSMAAYSNSGSVIRLISSYVANASYDYNKTYFLSLVSNISRLKEGIYIDYYHIFPSAAFSWDLSKQWPLKKINWIDNLNLYINWGKSGNYPLNGLGNDLYSTVYSTMGLVTSPHTRVIQIANHSLKHESTQETDYGFNSSFFL